MGVKTGLIYGLSQNITCSQNKEMCDHKRKSFTSSEENIIIHLIITMMLIFSHHHAEFSHLSISQYVNRGTSLPEIFGCIQIALQLIFSSLFDFWMWDK